MSAGVRTPATGATASRKWPMDKVLSAWSRQGGLRYVDDDGTEIDSDVIFSDRSWLPMIAARAEIDARRLFDISLGAEFYDDSAAFFGIAVRPILIERNEHDQFATAEQMVRAAVISNAAKEILGINRMNQVIRVADRLRLLQGESAAEPAGERAAVAEAESGAAGLRG